MARNNTVPSFIIVYFLTAWILAAPFAGEHATSRRTVMVVGCENTIKNKKWKDYRLSFGVIDLLAQNLYDSGLFALVEEKQEMRDKLNELNASLWRGDEEKKVMANAKTLADSSDLIIGRLLYYGAPRSQVSVGPMHVNRNEVIVKFETVLMTAGGDKIIGRGQGSASRSAMSTLFEFRENAVLLDQTAMGLALKDAVAKAVADLVVAYSKENKK